jgi:peptidoglycan/LPS O-acetylase OafA/YrhL
VRTYARRRAARVLPAYSLALAGSIVVLAGAAGTPGVRVAPSDQLALFAVFAQNLGPATIIKLDSGLLYDWAIAGHGLSQPWTKALPALLPLFAVGMLVAHLGSDHKSARDNAKR